MAIVTGNLFPDQPGLRRLPLALAKVMLFGAAAGPFLALFFGWAAGQELRDIQAHPGLWLWYSCLLGALFTTVFYITCALSIGYVKTLMTGSRQNVRGVAILLTAMGGGMAGCLISIGIAKELGVQVAPPLPLATLAVIDGLLAVAISIIVGLFRKARAESEARERKLSEAAAKAQACALQAQINPHFFFNTLNTISALIPLDPAAAQEGIGRLADMFRYTLSCSNSELAPLEAELDFARTYLLLEQARFRERLRFEAPANGAAGVRLPGLTLQPIVENAVKYGISQRIQGGAVRVTVERGAGECRITVSNEFDQADGPPDLRDEQVFRAGHALANVRDRLKLAFGPRAGFDIAVNGPGMVKATVRVPMEEGAR
jgi:hypothetical protein